VDGLTLVDGEFLVIAFRPNQECDHFSGSTENNKSIALSKWNSTDEKLGPRSFHAFFAGGASIDDLVDILFRLFEGILIQSLETSVAWIINWTGTHKLYFQRGKCLVP
jgi:hypothetical protein